MKITSKGQVTIPQHIREIAGLLPHTEVEFDYEDGKVTLKKMGKGASTRGERLIARLRGSATANPGMTTDQLMALTRGDD